jgi:hypothetical protein
VREAEQKRLEIWNSMTPEQRDYDRYMGKIPRGASWNPETNDGARAIEERQSERGYSVYEEGCSCHINPPCSYCTRDEADRLDDYLLLES